MNREAYAVLASRFKYYRESAEARLGALGFTQEGNKWVLSSHNDLPDDLSLQVIVPDDFPISLPRVLLDPSQLTRRIPHVESSGKICFVADSNILVNSAVPSQIIDECLTQAIATVKKGLSGENDDDFAAEFSAYWNTNLTGRLILISDLTKCDQARSMPLLSFKDSQNRMLNEEALLVTDNVDTGIEWLGTIGARPDKSNRRASAYFLPLDQTLRLPEEVGDVCYQSIREEIKRCTSNEVFARYSLWEHDPEITVRVVVLSFPCLNQTEKVCCAFGLDDPTNKLKEKVLKSCPPHKRQKTAVRLGEQYKLSMKPLQVLRFDPEYLIERGGGLLELYGKSVAIVGCGSVGSHIAERLAILGVGSLALFDPEKLSVDNLHRHVLGACHVGDAKCDALKKVLASRFPHISIEAFQKTVQHAQQAAPDVLDSHDLLVFATGEETLEREMSCAFARRKPSVHAWLEAYGVGYHVLSRGEISARGCFNCLYKETEPLSNKASFFEPGQDFKRNMPGCAGGFTPFSGLVASQLANETAEQVLNILTNSTTNFLVSVFLTSAEALKRDYKMSSRVKIFGERERKIVDDFTCASCEACG